MDRAQETNLWDFSREFNNLPHLNTSPSFPADTKMPHQRMGMRSAGREHPMANTQETHDPGSNPFSGNAAKTEEDTKKYEELCGNMTLLEQELAEHARHRQEMRTLQITTEEKFAEMEAKIQQVFERILEVDESSIGDGKYLIERLIRIEKSFDENLTTEISSLATNNTKI